MQNKPLAFIRELLKGKTEEEILEAENNFREYLQVMWDIYQRLEVGDSEKTLDFLEKDEDLLDFKE